MAGVKLASKLIMRLEEKITKPIWNMLGFACNMFFSTVAEFENIIQVLLMYLLCAEHLATYVKVSMHLLWQNRAQETTTP